MTASDHVRRVIRDSGVTHYRIGTDTGINIRTIDHFVTDGTSIHTGTFDVLCEYFGLELCQKNRRTTTRTAVKRTAKKRQTTTKQREK